MTTTARRLLLLGLLAATALLYLWTLSASGWANDFYSAAAQAASQSWKAFFGPRTRPTSSPWTSRRPPVGHGPVGPPLRGQLLSPLVPQALMGVATVALVHATVRRWFGPAAGLWPGP